MEQNDLGTQGVNIDGVKNELMVYTMFYLVLVEQAFIHTVNAIEYDNKGYRLKISFCPPIEGIHVERRIVYIIINLEFLGMIYNIQFQETQTVSDLITLSNFLLRLCTFCNLILYWCSLFLYSKGKRVIPRMKNAYIFQFALKQ